MATTQIKGRYQEDATFFDEAALLKHYRDTLPDDEMGRNKSNVLLCVFVLVLGRTSARWWAQATP
jgi:hypothetical protein